MWTDLTRMLLKTNSKTVTVYQQDTWIACKSTIGFGSIKHWYQLKYNLIHYFYLFSNAFEFSFSKKIKIRIQSLFWGKWHCLVEEKKSIITRIFLRNLPSFALHITQVKQNVDVKGCYLEENLWEIMRRVNTEIVHRLVLISKNRMLK